MRKNKAPIGRPPLPDSARRVIDFRMKLTKGEYARAKAAAGDVPIAAYIRTLLTRKPT